MFSTRIDKYILKLIFCHPTIASIWLTIKMQNLESLAIQLSKPYLVIEWFW